MFAGTSFSQYTCLEDKYQGERHAGQRKRWLLIESTTKANHDNLPILEYETKVHLSKGTYINTEKWFKIKQEHLQDPSKSAIIKLKEDSVKTVLKHHSMHYKTIMDEALKHSGLSFTDM
jgi:hypothetical protein